MAKPDKILAHELLDREVLDLRAGEVVGSVVDFGINREGKVQLIGILPTAWYGGGRGITPGSITFLTDDRLCIANNDALEDFAPDGDVLISTNSGGQIYGKTVLLHDGEMLGELADFRFNLGDGKITDLLVLDHEERRTRIPIEKITTIGKDYIIIERGAAAAEPGADGEASPFVSAAAVEASPTAAQPETASQPEVEPEPVHTPPARGKGRGKSTAFHPEPKSRTAEPVKAPEPAAAPAIFGDVLSPEPASVFASQAVSEAPPAPEPAPVFDAALVYETAPAAEEAAPAYTDPVPAESSAAFAAEAWAAAAEEPSPVVDPVDLEPAPDHGPVFEAPATNGNGTTHLDEVFDVPAAPPGPDDGILAAVASGQPISPPDGDPIATAPQISKFDQKKLDFLRGKFAHRDIKDEAGIILVAKDEVLDQAGLMRIVQGGVLGEVFIEMTLKK